MLPKLNLIMRITPILLWTLVMGLGLTPGAIAIAADSAAGIRSITPMGETGSFRQQADISAENYFDVVGILNVIENDRIVVGDSELKIAPGVNTSGARRFNIVGVKLNPAGEVVAFETIADEPN